MITEFYIFGYETVQYQDGFKPIVNISFKTDEGFKFIKHVLLDHKEVEAFFRSIDVEADERSGYRVGNACFFNHATNLTFLFLD